MRDLRRGVTASFSGAGNPLFVPTLELPERLQWVVQHVKCTACLGFYFPCLTEEIDFGRKPFTKMFDELLNGKAKLNDTVSKL